jgi:hypothetical protein
VEAHCDHRRGRSCRSRNDDRRKRHHEDHRWLWLAVVHHRRRNDGASIAGPWVFTSTTVVQGHRDRRLLSRRRVRVYDKDVPLGDTSEVASEFPACRFELFFPATARADAALADPAFSHGVIFIAPGNHAIEIENKALWSETSTGTGAFFRVDSVTVAKSDCKNGGWMNYGSLVKTQGQCLSVAT